MLKTHLQYQKKPAGSVSELLFAGQSLENFTSNYRGPAYIYSLDLLQNRFQVLQESWPALKIHYAMKANPHEKILGRLKSLGGKVDVVSGGELKRALASGMEAKDIIFSGVAKTAAEIELAVREQIHQLNVESLPELVRIIAIAERLQQKISVALRLNPDIEIKTHKYIATGLIDNKFGIELSMLPSILERLGSTGHVELAGISVHLGSQMLEFSGLREALKKLKIVFLDLQKKHLTCKRFDFGGGLGILYEDVSPKTELDLLQTYLEIVRGEIGDLRGVEFQAEPGRWLVAHAGILLTQVQYVKITSQKTFVILDSGMNHLLRPSLYEAYHWMGPVRKNSEPNMTADVVGPICESSDFFAKSRVLPTVKEYDFLVIGDCGAYGASMSNDYNLQDRAFEYFID